jgi:hypothetical protein
VSPAPACVSDVCACREAPEGFGGSEGEGPCRPLPIPNRLGLSLPSMVRPPQPPRKPTAQSSQLTAPHYPPLHLAPPLPHPPTLQLHSSKLTAHCTSLPPIAPHTTTAPHCSSPHLTSPHLTSSHLTVPHCTSLHRTSSHLTVPHYL